MKVRGEKRAWNEEGQVMGEEMEMSPVGYLSMRENFSVA